MDILFANFFEEEVNGPMRSGLEKQSTRKKANVSANEIIEFFLVKKSF
jgi:hypothetical protein